AGSGNEMGRGLTKVLFEKGLDLLNFVTCHCDSCVFKNNRLIQRRYARRRYTSSPSDAIEHSGELEIFFGQAPGVVGGQRQDHLVPADINVRMMPLLFRAPADGVDEAEGSGEIFEL